MTGPARGYRLRTDPDAADSQLLRELADGEWHTRKQLLSGGLKWADVLTAAAMRLLQRGLIDVGEWRAGNRHGGRKGTRYRLRRKKK